MADIENNGDQQQHSNYQQPDMTAANNEPKPQPASDLSEISDHELAEKSLPELRELRKNLTKPAAPEPKAKEPETPQPDKAKTEPQPPADNWHKRHEEDQRMIGRQSSEIGTLREELRKLKESLKKQEEPKEPKEPDIRDRILEDPESTIDSVIEKREREREEKQIAEKTRRAETESFILEKFPETKEKETAVEYAQVVVQMLHDDGYSPEEIQDFRSDPLKYPPLLLHDLLKRAKLVVENKRLQSEIEKHKAIPDKIVQASRSASIITRPATGSPAEDKFDISDAELAEMSLPELKALKKKMKKG